MSKILSGKVKKVSPSEVSADRYNFLSLGEAEPDLGVPAASGYLLSSDASGNRSWIESVVSIAGVVGEVSAQDLLDAIKTVDGTGSGLDADLLDGQSLGDLDNRYVNVDGDTMTGYLVINGVAPDTVTSLVTTGYVGVGNSSPSYELDVTGEINASVSVRAPIFYDSGDDSFYLDPANNATSLNVAGDIITAGDVSITGGITTVDSVQLNTSASVTVSTGEIAWNSDDETLDLGLTNGTVLQLGQEVHYHVQNQSGSTIADGRLVVAAGSIGNSGKILIEEWDPATYPPITIMGLTTETMANGESGYVTHFGKVRGIQTNGANYGETWLDGDIIYAGPSGGLTKVAPQAPNTKTIVALVITAHASNGTLFVRPTLSSSLANDDLVQLSSLSDNDLLYYNASNGRFENTSSLNTLTVDGINIDGTTISPSGVTAITVTGLETPVNATDAVNKAYVDGLVEGVSVRPAVKAATTANLSGTYDNGTDGIGATLNLGPAATLDIDGVTSWFEFDGVLVKDQTNAPENGRYYISQVGNASTDWILTRCGYCDEPAEIAAMYIFVQSGTVNAATGWVAVMSDSNSSGTLQVGIDDITFIQFSGAGTYTAGAGLELNGTVFSHADTSAAANLTASSRTYVTGLTFDTFGHVTGYTTGTETVVNTDTKYAISTEPGDNVYSKKIRLEGTDASSDDIVIAVGAVDTVYGLTISEAGDTITLAHANTSSVSNLSSDNANGNVIQDIALTFDTYGHVTGATVGTVNLDTRYDNYGSWTAQDGDTTSYTVTSGDILQFAEGNDINVNFTADDVLTFSHVDIARTDTNDTLSPGYGGSFTVVDSVTTSDRGHVTAVNLKTVTLPSADDTNTTYAISVEAGGDAYSEKIRLTGSDSTTDDVTIAVGAVDTVYGLTIGRTNDVITLAHANTSSVSNLSSDNSNGTVIQDIALTFDTYGHVTGATAATVDLDSRYVNVTGDTMTGDLKIEKNQAKLILSSTEGNPTDQSIQIRNEPIDANLPGSEGIGIIFETTSTNGSPDTTPAVITTGEFYAQSNQKVFHDNYHPNADTLTTARTISLTGDVTGSVSFNGSANVSITATVADDSHDHIISNVDGLQDALDLKAPLASPALTGTPTAPTAAATTNDTQIATTAFVQTAVANLVDAAPGTLDTLNELAAALGDDPNFATTVTNAIAAKVSKSGDTMTGVLTLQGAGQDRLVIRNTTNGGGAGINFSDQSTPLQTGTLKFVHTDSASYGGGAAFIIEGSEPITNLVVTEGNVISLSSVRAPIFYDYDNTAYYVDPANSTTSAILAGNVGIGTTSPAGRLDVLQNTSGSLLSRLWNNNTSGTGTSIFRIANSGNNVNGTRLELTDASYYVATISADRTDGLKFYVGQMSSALVSERMRIDINGNVGIGVTSPSAKLVVRDVNPTDGVILNLQNNGASSLTGSKIVFNQNTVANWNIGQPAATNAFVICNSSSTTNEYLRITSAGNVGVGTTTPISKLDVRGIDSNVAQSITLGVSSTRYWNMTIGAYNATDNAYDLTFDMPSYDGSVIFATQGNEHMRVDFTGNVGIGTNDPISKFHVENTVVGNIAKFKSATANGQMIDVRSTSTGVQLLSGFSTGIVGSFDITASGGNSYLTLGTNATERVRVTSGGNVGIGTTNPVGKLEVVGDVIQQSYVTGTGSNLFISKKARGTISAPTVILNGDVVGGLISGGYDGSTYRYTSAVEFVANGTVSSGVVPMAIRFSTGTTTTYAERMRITSTGNVGIGTTAPSQKLHVVGTGYATTDFRAPIFYDSDNTAYYVDPANSTTSAILAGNVGVGTTAPASKLQVEGDVRATQFRLASTGVIDDSAATTTATTQVAIDSWSATTYGGGKVIIEAKDGVNRHITELLVTHDGTTAIATEYGVVHTAGQLATYDVDISGGNVRILATPASTNSTSFKVMRTTMFA